MIDWNKGLTEAQEELLVKLLKEESKIPLSWYYITDGKNIRKEFGRLLPRNKLIRERESGYTYYLEINNKIYNFCAFKYTINKIEEN